jgi:hypothetical protein
VDFGIVRTGTQGDESQVAVVEAERVVAPLATAVLEEDELTAGIAGVDLHCVLPSVATPSGASGREMRIVDRWRRFAP